MRNIPKGWQELEIKDFLKFTPREIEKPKVKYLSLGIRSHCKGTFIREVENPDKVMMETLYAVKKDDLIVNITFAWEGAVALVNKSDEGALVSHRFPTYVFDRNVVVPEFFRYLIPSKRLVYNLGIISPGGAGRNRVLDRKYFQNLQFIMPPVEEQKVIAEIISTWDRAIETLGNLMDSKTSIKRALMKKFLTGKQRLSGYSGTWKIKKLCDVADIDPENLGSNTSPNFKFKYISLEDVDLGVLKNYSNQVFSTAPSRARRKLNKGDILVATVRPNLKSHLLFDVEEPNWICSTGFSVVRCKDKIAHPSYIYFHLFSDSVSRQFEMMLTGSNYPAINGKDVRALKIPMPAEYSEQSDIAKILITADIEINRIENLLTLLTIQKRGLMQKLLTGKIRMQV